MNNLPKILAIGLVSLLPLPALAADPAAPGATAPAATATADHQGKGFDKYWSKMDPTGKGFVTKDEWMAHAAERFKEIDTNGDGKISKEEMKAHDDKMREHYKEMRAHHDEQK